MAIDSQVLIFSIDIIVMMLGLIGLKYPFISLMGVLVGCMVIIFNISILSGILLTFSICTIFISASLFAYSMFVGDKG